MGDQFTRFLCRKCGEAGHDSWNKAAYDGPHHDGEVPNPLIYGDECQKCGWPAVIAWSAPGEQARAIYGPDPDSYDYEPHAIDLMERSIGNGSLLEWSTVRDADWSGGCTAAKGQLQ